MANINPFKFELGQLVFYMMDNKIHSAEIRSRMIIENRGQRVSPEFGADGTYYETIHGSYSQDDLFATKEELLNSL